VSNGTVSTKVRAPSDIPLVLRVLWFIFVGWHVTLYWVLVAWALNVSILGLPLGLWMLNRVPQVLTLRPARGYTVSGVREGRVVSVRHEGVRQRSWLVRLPYFVLIGWWFSLLWSLAAWAMCACIIGLPVGIPMLNGLPGVTTLHRG
jgi:uncharacterized membrane protein YccF (DUF307 family)